WAGRDLSASCPLFREGGAVRSRRMTCSAIIPTPAVPPPPSPASTSCPSRGTSLSPWRDAHGLARACPCGGRAGGGRGGSERRAGAALALRQARAHHGSGCQRLPGDHRGRCSLTLGTDQRVSLKTGSTNGGRLVIAAHMPGGEFGSGHSRRRMATAPSKMSWISEQAPTPSAARKNPLTFTRRHSSLLPGKTKSI